MKRLTGYFLLLWLAGCDFVPAPAPNPEPERPVTVRLLFRSEEHTSELQSQR